MVVGVLAVFFMGLVGGSVINTAYSPEIDQKTEKLLMIESEQGTNE